MYGTPIFYLAFAAALHCACIDAAVGWRVLCSSIRVACLVTMQPERRQALKAEPLRGGAGAPALTACRRPGHGLSKQTKDDWGRVHDPIFHAEKRGTTAGFYEGKIKETGTVARRIFRFIVACTPVGWLPDGTIILRPQCRDRAEFPVFVGPEAAPLLDGKIKRRTVRCCRMVVFQGVTSRFRTVRENGAQCDFPDYSVLSIA